MPLPPPAFGDLGLGAHHGATWDKPTPPTPRPSIPEPADMLARTIAASRAWIRLEGATEEAELAMRSNLEGGPKSATFAQVASACRRASAAQEAHALACARARGEP